MRHIVIVFLYITFVGAENVLATTCTNDPVLEETLTVNTPGLSNPHYDIVAARIVEIKDGEGATNERTPTVLLEINAVLRGHLKPSAYDAVWRGALRRSDYIDPDNYRSGIKPSWHECPLSTPPVGTDIIAFVLVADDGSSLVVNESNVFRNTSHNRSVVSRNAAPAERQGKIQKVLFIAIVAFPVAGMVLIFTRLIVVGGLLSFSVFPLYVYYESGFSIYSNIRIDKLLIWPMLGLALIGMIIFMSRYPRDEVASGEGSSREKNES